MQMSVKKSAAPVASPTHVLSAYLSAIRYEDLPQPVVARTEELFLDWFASALAGKGARPVSVIGDFAQAMGPQDGAAENLLTRQRTSPFFAALWEFLRDAADSKQLHTAKAAANGLMAAYITRDGRTLECRVETPKGDPSNTLSHAELEGKAQRLAAYSGAATADEMRRVIARIWRLRDESGVRDFMAAR